MDEPRFIRFHVIVRHPSLKPGNMDLKWGKKEDYPEVSESEVRTLYLNLPEENEPHVALGRYLDAWSRVEQAISYLLAYATGIRIQYVHVLMNSLGTHGIRDVISTLAPLKLSKSDSEVLGKLLASVKGHNTKRNRIVHGSWAVEARIYDWNGTIGAKGFIYRVYDPADPQIREAMVRGENKEARKSYMFSIARINSLTRALKDLAVQVNRFTSQVTGSPSGGVSP